jgi:hypothetical protein
MGIITDREILDIMEASPAGRKLCIVDACLPDTTGPMPGLPPLIESEVAFLRSADLRAADTGSEYGSSWFTFMVLAGLRRAADRQHGGLTTLNELYPYLLEAIPFRLDESMIPQFHPGADPEMVLFPVD